MLRGSSLNYVAVVVCVVFCLSVTHCQTALALVGGGGASAKVGHAGSKLSGGLNGAASLLASSFRPPAVPLIVFSPEHSIWSTSDNLNSDVTRFWSTEQVIGMVAAIRVDGISYRLMGDGSAQYGIATDQLAQQTSVTVFPTTTQYQFVIPSVNIGVTLEFFTPAFAEDIATLALPITYVTFKVDLTQAVGTAKHSIAVYFDVMGNHAVTDESEDIVWADLSNTAAAQVLLSLGSAAQNYYSVVGDRVRMSWGHVYLSAIDVDERISHTIATANLSRTAFTRQNPLPPLDVRQPRAANDDSAALSMLIDFGDLSKGQVAEQTVLYAYDDVQSILFFGNSYAPYWRKVFADDLNAFITFALNSYPLLRTRGDLFDSDLLDQLNSAAGSNYASVGALAFRQTTGALKIVYDASLPTASQQPIVFMKEISSDGDVSTVDVIYPSSPFFILLSPEVLRLTLLPVLEYANNETNILYNLTWAPHHLGTWPVCDITPEQQEQMPMEETANFMLMIAAIAQRQARRVDYLQKYRPLLDGWAAYLSASLPDPEDQLCTDDFEGPSPHNVNLAAKGIVGLAAYSLIVRYMGDSAAADKWLAAAVQFAGNWVTMSADGGSGGVLPHSRLQYDLPKTWSLKYNMLFQKILRLDVFPQSAIDNDTLYYATQAQKYGVPLDDRAIFTKTDWLSWVAATAFDTQPQIALSFLDAIFNFANASPSRVPFTDWYDTSNANQQGFQARPVIGGIFAHLLLRST